MSGGSAALGDSEQNSELKNEQDEQDLAKDRTPKQFMALKRPENNYERVACCAYYLTHYRSTPHFTTGDIHKLNTESANHFSNAAQSVMHATSSYHYLSAAGGGKKQITTLGEAVVQALPDRAKIAEAIAAHKPRKRRKRRTAAKAK